MKKLMINIYAALQARFIAYRYTILALCFVMLACIDYVRHYVVSIKVIFLLIMAVAWGAAGINEIKERNKG